MAVRVYSPALPSVELFGAYEGIASATRANEIVSITFTPTEGNLTVVPYDGDYSIRYLQIEPGSIPTSYIPTSGSQGARAEDVLTIPDAPWPSSDPGSRAIGISMKGLMTYADTGTTEATFYRWYIDNSNRIVADLRASGTDTGKPYFFQAASGTLDDADGSIDTYSPGINVPFSIASYHKDNGINGAVDGVALTEDATPTILPDLSATPIQIRASGGPIYLEEMRIWVEGAVDKITDALIEEASAP